MTKVDIDQIDIQIIDILQNDARMSAVEIANQLGDVSPRVVRYRIEKLVEAGIITLTAIVNPKSLGYSIRADVLVECERGKISDTLRDLAALDNVTRVCAVTGDHDINMTIVVESMENLYKFVEEVQENPGVRRTHTYVVSNKIKFSHQWKIPMEIRRNVLESE
jgi:DNA-binding Lrp family transcriptional regulator